MTPQALLRALMAEQGLNPNSLSKNTGKKTKQPQIHRFLTGEAKEPKRSTLRPVADYFDVPVDAFFDEKVATKVWAERQAAATATATAPSPSSSVAAQAPEEVTLQDALPAVLGRLPGLDEYTAGKVLGALTAATKPAAPLEQIERDLLLWLSARAAASDQAKQAV